MVERANSGRPSLFVRASEVSGPESNTAPEIGWSDEATGGVVCGGLSNKNVEVRKAEGWRLSIGMMLCGVELCNGCLFTKLCGMWTPLRYCVTRWPDRFACRWAQQVRGRRAQRNGAAEGRGVSGCVQEQQQVR